MAVRRPDKATSDLGDGVGVVASRVPADPSATVPTASLDSEVDGRGFDWVVFWRDPDGRIGSGPTGISSRLRRAMRQVIDAFDEAPENALAQGRIEVVFPSDDPRVRRVVARAVRGKDGVVSWSCPT